jgi:hypothetical protein
MGPEELKDRMERELKHHLETVHGVDVTDIRISLQEAHQQDHDEWMHGDHEHEED